MAGISIPQRKPNNQLGQLLTIGGMAAGAALGGPAGAATGGSLGGMIGGLQAQNQSAGPAQVGRQNDSAMQRRMLANQEDRLQALREATLALPQLPPEMRQEYAKPLLTAYTAEAKSRGVNPWEGMG